MPVQKAPTALLTFSSQGQWNHCPLIIAPLHRKYPTSHHSHSLVSPVNGALGSRKRRGQQRLGPLSPLNYISLLHGCIYSHLQMNAFSAIVFLFSGCRWPKQLILSLLASISPPWPCHHIFLPQRLLLTSMLLPVMDLGMWGWVSKWWFTELFKQEAMKIDRKIYKELGRFSKLKFMTEHLSSFIELAPECRKRTWEQRVPGVGFWFHGLWLLIG